MQNSIESNQTEQFDFDRIPPWETVEIPGWPGYRNRAGRSGLDPLETEFEAYHMMGVAIRRLIDRDFPSGSLGYRLYFISAASFIAITGVWSFGFFLYTFLLFIDVLSPLGIVILFTIVGIYHLYMRALFRFADDITNLYSEDSEE